MIETVLRGLQLLRRAPAWVSWAVIVGALVLAVYWMHRAAVVDAVRRDRETRMNTAMVADSVAQAERIRLTVQLDTAHVVAVRAQQDAARARAATQRSEARADAAARALQHHVDAMPEPLRAEPAVDSLLQAAAAMVDANAELRTLLTAERAAADSARAREAVVRQLLADVQAATDLQLTAQAAIASGLARQYAGAQRRIVLQRRVVVGTSAAAVIATAVAMARGR